MGEEYMIHGLLEKKRELARWHFFFFVVVYDVETLDVTLFSPLTKLQLCLQDVNTHTHTHILTT